MKTGKTSRAKDCLHVKLIVCIGANMGGKCGSIVLNDLIPFVSYTIDFLLSNFHKHSLPQLM